MNKDKAIKDLKERNDKLQSQYMQEQSRNYHLNYKIENELIPKITGYEYEIITLRSDFEAQHEKTCKYYEENQRLKKENKILRENADHNDKVVDKVNWENQQLKDRIDKAIQHLDCFISDVNLSKYDILKILMHTKKILKGVKDD